jgi:uncharacterized protein (UPF0332 family)
VKEGPLEASRTELAAARHLNQGGFPSQAVSRAYYAAFRAAKVAIEELGEKRSKHGAVISAFFSRLIKEEGLEVEAGKILRSLFERRNKADYAYAEPTAEMATQAIEDAERFVDTVARWLEGRAPSQPG